MKIKQAVLTFAGWGKSAQFNRMAIAILFACFSLLFTKQLIAQNPQLALIHIIPASATMQVGDQQQFQAMGDDGNGNTVILTNPQWSIDGGASLTPNTNLCIVKAEQTGTHTLTCREGGTTVEGHATITISTNLVSIEISPSNASLNVGQQRDFTATGKDQYGNTVTITHPTWTTTGGGTLTPSGNTCTYTATTAGSYTITCKENCTTIKGTATVRINLPTGIASTADPLPAAFALEQNYPNPFNPITTIAFSVKKNCHVLLQVFDIKGREVCRLTDDEYPAGSYRLSFSAADLPSGLYLYKIKMGHFQKLKKMLLLK